MKKRMLYRGLPRVRRYQLRKGDIWIPTDDQPARVWAGFFKGWKEIGR